MSKGYTVAPWRPIPGSGQTLVVTTASATFANAVGAASLGAQTRALWLSLAPAATATGATFRISQAGTAATAALDFFIKTTDPPLLVGCSPGDKVSVIGLAAGTAYLTELTN